MAEKMLNWCWKSKKKRISRQAFLPKSYFFSPDKNINGVCICLDTCEVGQAGKNRQSLSCTIFITKQVPTWIFTSFKVTLKEKSIPEIIGKIKN